MHALPELGSLMSSSEFTGARFIVLLRVPVINRRKMFHADASFTTRAREREKERELEKLLVRQSYVVRRTKEKKVETLSGERMFPFCLDSVFTTPPGV